MKPKSKPQATRQDIEKILKANGVSLDTVSLVGIEGYYLDSMGAKGANDRGIYDDALFWIGPNVFASFNGNTDPSAYRKGQGTGSKKGMAHLKDGVWEYKTGIHNGSSPHPAFRQNAEVIVIRDGLNGNYEEKGWFGINIHRGGAKSTSSLGCQTVPPDQWAAFKELGYLELKRASQKSFKYVKISEINRRKGRLKV